jgi:glucuronate isomerase
MRDRPSTWHEDRLLPADPGVRRIARRLYEAVADAPIVSPHGHVPVERLRENRPFADAADLLVTPDHYVTRVLHAHGVSLPRLGITGASGSPVADGRSVWREFCARWRAFEGTQVGYWTRAQLHDVFGIETVPSTETADRLFDEIGERLADAAFRPRALLERFGVRVLATTDDPVSSLEHHRALAAEGALSTIVVPTFRADRFMDPSSTVWSHALDELEAVSGLPCDSHHGLIDALRARRAAFITAGATSADVGVPDAECTPLSEEDAERIHRAGREGTITAVEGAAYRRHMFYRFAGLSAEDGLVMQVHPGVMRDHHGPTSAEFGPDRGADIPTSTAYTAPLRPILDSFGTVERFRMVLFTVDETAFAREIAPLAGFYPSVYAGAPWWFLDTVAGMRRYREAVTDSAGFGKTSGFIDDTRALCSIPVRHDSARRVDAGYLAGLVAEHRLDEDAAESIAREIVGDLPTRVFRLPAA